MLCAYLNHKLGLNHHLLTGIMYIDLSTTLIYYAECLSEFQTRIRSSSSHWNHVQWLLNYPCLLCFIDCLNLKLEMNHHLIIGIMYNDLSTTLCLLSTRIELSSSHWNYIHWLLNYPCLLCCVLIWTSNLDWVVVLFIIWCMELSYELHSPLMYFLSRCKT